MNNDDEDELNGFSPGDEDGGSVAEYNPYADFMSDEEESKESAEDLTTEDDISLPDFLQNESEENTENTKSVEDFKESVSSMPSRQDESNNSVIEHKDKNSSFSPEKTETDSDVKPHSNFADVDNPKMEKSEEKSDENNSKNSVNYIQEKQEEHGGNTSDKEEDRRFKPKVSAKDADNHHGGKPKLLNKRFLLGMIIMILLSILLITFLMPTKKSKSDKNKKPVATIPGFTDYAAIADRHSVPQPHVDNDKSVEIEKKKEEPVQEKKKEEEVVIPPVIPVDQKPVYNAGTGTNSNSGPKIEIPDTRNDALHGKMIAGIKGLSSTQDSYSTDYQKTIEKNTASVSPLSSFSLPSKDEYMKNVLSSYTQAYGNANAGNNAYAVQNDQSGKKSFYNEGRNSNAVGTGEWLNLNTLWQGTIFEAVLTSELNTDLPGEITARIAKNVYSSQDGRYLLIPQNSVVYGTYNSSISYSQNRVQVAWHTIIRPDGYKISLGNMNATDAKGASGLKGFVNDHPLAYLKAIALMSVVSIANAEFQNAMGSTQNEYVQNIVANTQEVTMELGQKLIDRAMNVQPTIKIKAGTKINIVVNQNMSLPPCDDIPVTQAYKRKK